MAKRELPFTIVPFRSEHALGRGFVHYQAWIETYTGLVDEAFLATRSIERSVVIAEAHPEHCYVALVNEAVVGFVIYGPQARFTERRAGEIQALYVLKDYQGYRIGRALLEVCLAANPHPETDLFVLAGNDRAIHFYEHLGFTMTGYEKNDDRGLTVLRELEMARHDTLSSTEAIVFAFAEILRFREGLDLSAVPDPEAVYHLYQANETFARLAHMFPVTREAVVKDITEIPPMTDAAHKRYCSIYNAQYQLIAVLDFVNGYAFAHPESETTVWIGLFEIAANLHRQGYGHRLLEAFTRGCLAQHVNRLQIGVIKTNEPAMAFWTKEGFRIIAEKTADGLPLWILEKMIGEHV